MNTKNIFIIRRTNVRFNYHCLHMCFTLHIVKILDLSYPLSKPFLYLSKYQLS